MTRTRSSFVLLAMLVSHAVSPSAVQGQEKSGGDISVRQRAEDLAREASKRFSEILAGETGNKVAQGPRAEAEPLDAVWDWLGQASKAYRGVIITKLKSPHGEVAILVPPGGVAPKLPMEPAAGEAAREPEPRLGWSYLVESVREWLARANRSYRTEIVKKLVQPQPGVPTRTAGGIPEPASPPPPEPAPQQIAAAPKADAAGDVAEKAAAPKVEEKIAEEAEADAKGKAEAEAAAKRRAEAEDKRKAQADAAAKRKAEEEAKRKAQAEAAAKRKAEAEAKRKAKAEAAAKRKAEAEDKRKAEAEAEATRKAEAKLKAEAEAQARRLAEEAEAERKAVAEAEAKRMAAAVPTTPKVTEEKQPVPTPPERKAPAPAVDSAPIARKEAVVSEPPPPEAKSSKQGVSKTHYRKKRLRRRATVRHAHVYARRHEHKAWRKRSHRHVRGRKRRGCHKHHGHRHREVRGWSGRVYVVRRGDTLSKIARRHYGTSAGYRAIYRANRHRVRSPNLIYARQRLYIPSRWR